MHLEHTRDKEISPMRPKTPVTCRKNLLSSKTQENADTPKEIDQVGKYLKEKIDDDTGLLLSKGEE